MAAEGSSMSSVLAFQTQIASVMEVFANAAVAEICKVVEVSYTELQMEILKGQKENTLLKRRLKMVEMRESFYKRASRLKDSAGGQGEWTHRSRFTESFDSTHQYERLHLL